MCIEEHLPDLRGVGALWIGEDESPARRDRAGGISRREHRADANDGGLLREWARGNSRFVGIEQPEGFARITSNQRVARAVERGQLACDGAIVF